MVRWLRILWFPVAALGLFGQTRLMLALIAVVAVGAFLYRRSMLSRWSAAAEQLGLSLDTGGLLTRPSLSGTVQGVPVETFAATEYRGFRPRDFRSFFVYRVQFGPDGPPVRITHAAQDSVALRKRFGLAGDSIGDPSFERHVMVETPKPEAFRNWLTAHKRLVILDVIANMKPAEITHQTIEGRTKLSLRAATSSAIVENIERLVGAALVLDDAASNGLRLLGDLTDWRQ